MGEKVQHGLHPGISIYRLPPDCRWLIVDSNDGENCASELASAIGESAVHLSVGEYGEQLYLHFPSFNSIARSPIADAIRDHGIMSPETKEFVEAEK